MNNKKYKIKKGYLSVPFVLKIKVLIIIIIKIIAI